MTHEAPRACGIFVVVGVLEQLQHEVHARGVDICRQPMATAQDARLVAPGSSTHPKNISRIVSDPMPSAARREGERRRLEAFLSDGIHLFFDVF